MQSGSSVAVIGSGLGGLAAACVSAARGHRVTLYDKNDWLGGKAAVLHEGGFRFDMGPTILTVPRVLERIFSEAGRSVHDYMDLRRLDPQWRCFFDDGTRIDLMQDVATMAAEMDRFVPGAGAGEGYKKFLAISEHLHGVSEKFFFWKPVEDLFDTINIRANMNPGTLRDVLSLRMHASVASTIRGKVKDARLAQMLDHFVQYVGSSPYGAPAVLCAIAHMQTADGVWYPMGGTRAVAEGLMKLAEELGATLKPNTEVTGLDIVDGAVRGLRTREGTAPYDAVISNMDSVRTYRELVGGEAGKAYERKNPEPACSGVVLYLGLNRRYEHLNHHDFVFSRDPEEEFDWIYRRGEPAPDPTAYLAAPSSTDPSVAPDGGEALYVLVHTPYLRPHHDWSKMFPAYRRVILDKLKRTAGMPDLEDRIVVERHLTPQDIHDRYKVLNGAIYGLASHGRVMGAFKPGNRSRQVRGLYLAGGAAHPGPGMPMVMMSGWIAADAHDQDARGGLRKSA
ncbi:phytoene desaturase family protein [Methylobacterium dankookense]|uniref:Diapolycopene oxygenase n=1 Tax=Methylobacterium dankookense TaxID=560405 RepID=A0A564FSV0_9HYPH|nr:phytoene desaturase family protein [Methylobacterium dankookense]GJD57217.1 4,4'-diapolycopene oxygenase [Methylobacterium dankookense]VUF10836.1 Diapolycopene oxygenase [Methylobacterium dankookense]